MFRARRLVALLCLAGGVMMTAATLDAQEVLFEDSRQSGRKKKHLEAYAQRVQIWGMVQRIVGDVRAQNETPVPDEEVQATDRSWRTGEPPAELVQHLTTNECAQALQSVLSSSPGYASAYVTDRTGTLVCMSSRADGYSMAREAPFLRSYAGGSGAIFIAKPHQDPFLGIDVLEISVPVRDRTEVIGVLTAVRLVDQEE
ncbi:MAG: PDC sensor domain-containing protein [Thermoanaerobaculia bacterium]|nr:PDC sensor domain-containing protein [Thermoanaerobaculia bacterium]